MLSGALMPPTASRAAPCQCIRVVKPCEASERGLHFRKSGGGRDLEHVIEGHRMILTVRDMIEMMMMMIELGEIGDGYGGRGGDGKG